MATSDSKWSDDEQRALLTKLAKSQWRVDISDTYTMGYLVLGTSMKLSRIFDRRVTRPAVVEEILFLRDRYANFVQFINLPGVSYNQWDNKVTTTDKYLDGGKKKESWQMLGYRLHGEPLYRYLKTAFVVGRADVADFDWLLRSFDQEEGVSLEGDDPWPLQNTGIAKELEDEGYALI
ncbi:auxin response factor 6 [Perilla frutescens var. hirtella]|nr:auxin response factor 6 [Perilla frutescens var. frutescens]KAH6775857.1 auxin response factor 6 [Perilla frutescens var. hirtella]